MAPGLYTPSSSFSRQNSSETEATLCNNEYKEYNDVASLKRDNSSEGTNTLLMSELRKKIATFRHIIDLPPDHDSGPITEVITATLLDLNKLYPNIITSVVSEETEQVSLHQGLFNLFHALESIGDIRANNQNLVAKSSQSLDCISDTIELEQLGARVLERLDSMIRATRQHVEVMDEEKIRNVIPEETSGIGSIGSSSDNKNTSPSQLCSTSVSPELTKLSKLTVSRSMPTFRPTFLPLKLQEGEMWPSSGVFPLALSPRPAPGKDRNEWVAEQMKIFQHHAVRSPKSEINRQANSRAILEAGKHTEACLPVASSMPSQGRGPPPPPPTTALVPLPKTSQANGTAPPPPPPPSGGVSKFLRLKKAYRKLKRSSHMGSMYRTLKRKLEGSNSVDMTSHNVKPWLSSAAKGKQGMAEALAEMAKRSAYFHQIEEDIQKHSEMIMKMKAEIHKFQTNNMAELLKFHRHVEQHLENLNDETQVLARFEFPRKKLESLRAAAALHLKLEGIACNLENWKIEPPLGQLLDKVEGYFNKIKGDIEALERTKDEDSKHFKSNNIDFDFNILEKIKEAMVDVSSGCMELALKERREATGLRKHASIKMLWRAFQLAFRVYTFAGGQDDRADNLTKELGQEIGTAGPEIEP